MLWRLSSALFIDKENVALSPDKIANWLNWIEDGQFDGGIRRRLVLKRIYWNASDERHRKTFQSFGFEVIYCEKFSGMKNGADIRMAMDIAEVTLQRPHISEIILITTDSDFVPVLQRMQERKKRSAIVVSESNPAIHTTYRQHADVLIPRRLLGEAEQYVRPRRSWLPWKTVAAKSSAPTPRQLEVALDQAVDCVIKVTSPRPKQYTAQKTILSALSAVAEFKTNGAGSFLGKGNYKALMKELARRDTRINVSDTKGGGISVMYLPAPE